MFALRKPIFKDEENFLIRILCLSKRSPLTTEFVYGKEFGINYTSMLSCFLAIKTAGKPPAPSPSPWIISQSTRYGCGFQERTFTEPVLEA